MAVALVDTTTSGTTDAQTDNRTVPVPAGATSAHVAVIDLEIWLDTSTDPTISWPTGFDQIGYVESATDGFTRLYRAISTNPTVGQSGGNYAMSWSGSYWNQAQCSLWSGVDQTTPQDVATASAVTASNRNHTAASLTTVNAGCGMLYGTANENNATATAPTGYTQQETANYLKTYTKIAGAAGTESITAGANPWSTATVKVGLLTALRPASSGTAMNLSSAAGSGAAQALSSSKAAGLGSAAGSGAAQVLTSSKALALDAAAGTGAPQPMSFSKGLALGTATGTGAAQPLSLTGDVPMPLGPATGTGAPQPMSFSKGLALGVATGAGAPAGIGADKGLTLAQAAGAGAAQALTPGKSLGLQNAAGSGAAQAAGFTAAGSMALGTAAGTGVPQPMAFSKNLALSPAAGSGAVQAVALAKALELAAATGAGTAQALSNGKGLPLGAAQGAGAPQAMTLQGPFAPYTAPTEWTVSTPPGAAVNGRPQAHTAITRRTPYTATTREHE